MGLGRWYPVLSEKTSLGGASGQTLDQSQSRVPKKMTSVGIARRENTERGECRLKGYWPQGSSQDRRSPVANSVTIQPNVRVVGENPLRTDGMLMVSEHASTSANHILQRRVLFLSHQLPCLIRSRRKISLESFSVEMYVPLGSCICYLHYSLFGAFA